MHKTNRYKQKKVLHYEYEQNWYQNMVDRRSLSDGATVDVKLVNDHSSDLEFLARLEEGDIETQANNGNITTLQTTSYSCRHCTELIYHKRMTRVEIEAHLRKK